MSKPNLYRVTAIVYAPHESGEGYEMAGEGIFDIDLNEQFTRASCAALLGLFATEEAEKFWPHGDSESLVIGARFPMLDPEWVYADRNGRLVEVDG